MSQQEAENNAVVADPIQTEAAPAQEEVPAEEPQPAEAPAAEPDQPMEEPA